MSQHLKKIISFAGLFIGVAVVGCSDHSKTTDTANVDQNQAANPGTSENYQAPGQIGQVNESTGSTTIQTKKTTQEAGTEKIPTVDQTYHKADINRLSSDQFQVLGLSKDVADAAVKYRKEHGDFNSVDDLNQVPGIKAAWLDKMKDKLGVDQSKMTG